MATEYRSEDSSAGNAELGNPIDPANVDAIATEPAGKFRKPRSDRGKPRGPRTASAKKAAASSLDLSGLAGVIVGLTAAVAQWRDVPEIEIDESEAKELMSATQNVLRHYSIETTQKGADYIALVGVVAMIAGTRISAYNLRRRVEREEQQAKQFKPTIVPMNAKQPENRGSVPTGPVDDSGGF